MQKQEKELAPGRSGGYSTDRGNSVLRNFLSSGKIAEEEWCHDDYFRKGNA